MLLRLECQSCGVHFRVDSRHAGKRGACPAKNCRKPFVVPGVEELKLSAGFIKTTPKEIFGKMVISEKELDSLADELAKKLGWSDAEPSAIAEPVHRSRPGSLLQPCGVMPMEAIEHLRQQNKIQSYRYEETNSDLIPYAEPVLEPASSESFSVTGKQPASKRSSGPHRQSLIVVFGTALLLVMGLSLLCLRDQVILSAGDQS